jgi:hypothetical protein
MPALAQAAEFSSVDPKPIPETLFGTATPFHIQLPGPDTELSAISDFNGVLGVAAVSGTGTGTNTNTGASNPLVFDADMRFMQGQYIGMDGQNHEGTFVFVWLDLFPSQVGVGQIHDFNLDINPFPHGLFWTRRFPEETVSANPDTGRASAIAKDVKLPDYGNIGNALSDGLSVPAEASFAVTWTGGTGAFSASSSLFTITGQSTGATIAWSATEAGFAFKSAPADSSTKNFAVVGRERNGAFR